MACHPAYVEETDWMVRAHMIREVGPSEPSARRPRGPDERYAGMGTDAVVERFGMLSQRNLAELDGMDLGEPELTLEGLHPTLGWSPCASCWPPGSCTTTTTWQLQGALSAHYVAEVGPWRSFLGILDRVEP